MLGGVYVYRLEPARVTDAAQLAAMSQQLVEAGLRPSWGAARIGWHVRHADSVVLTATRRASSSPASPSCVTPTSVAHLNLLAVAPAASPPRRRAAPGALARGDGAHRRHLHHRTRAARRQRGRARLLRSLGYRELGEIPGYYQGVEAALRMERDVRAAARAAPH